MIQHYLNHPLCWKTVVDLLGLAVNVIEGNPKAFKSHLHSLYDGKSLMSIPLSYILHDALFFSF